MRPMFEHESSWVQTVKYMEVLMSILWIILIIILVLVLLGFLGRGRL